MYEYFRQIIDSRGITTYMVSKATGISQSTFSDWKRGRYQPKLNKLIKIADYLGVSINELIGRKEN